MLGAMNDAIVALDPFLRGIAAGAMGAISLGLLRSQSQGAARALIAALGVSLTAWLITESHVLWGALGRAPVLVVLAYPVAGLFWMFVTAVFEDRPVRPVLWAAPCAMLAIGLFMGSSQQRYDQGWPLFNGLAGLLAAHAGCIVLRGWRGDLIERRRLLRGLILGLVSVFALGQVLAAYIANLDPAGPWKLLTISQSSGVAILAVLMVAATSLFLEGRPEVFGPSRSAAPAVDPRLEAADRLVLARLQAFLDKEGWRREGLSIGALADELNTTEHTLRRLINGRLGYRNFADFLNSSRIEAARRALTDPEKAGTSIAALAFELGYGSLGPFNRAFRAATGKTPTEWRRSHL